jgi:DNA-binding SARP family transcriptional activator
MFTRGRFQLRTLGRLALLDASGHEDPSLSTRPRKLALLAWLVLRPERRATRDRIIGVFWGDRDEERARNSLSDAVSHVRRVLGRESIRTQGTEIVIADDAPLAVDALEMAGAASRGDHTSVVSLYRGPFLDGFYVNDAPEFDDWRDRERSRLEATFAKSARVRCAELAAKESWDECYTLAERWLDSEPASGEAALALLRAIDAPGTHSAHVATLAAFEKVKARLERDLAIAPDARASAFAKEVGDRLAEAPPPPPPAITLPPVSVSSPVAEPPAKPSRRWRLIGGAAFAAVVLVGVAELRSPRLDRRRVIVAALQNRTGDSTLRALGAVAADWVSRGLVETHSVEVADPLLAPTDPTDDPRIIGRRAQAGVVVLLNYARQGDSLEIDARLVDANTGRVLRATPTVVGSMAQPIAAIDALRQRIAGAMAAEVDPVIASLAREASQPPTYEAYLAWIEGLDAYAHRDYRGAITPFLRAAALDSTFVSPRIWMLAAYGNLGEPARADSIRLAVLPFRGRMAPLDRGLLDMWTATLHGDRQAQYFSSRATLAAAPGSELAIYLAGVAALFVNRPNEAVALLRRLPAERSAVTWDVYGTRLAQALHAAGRHDEELAETTRRLAHAPGSQQAMEEHAKALIAVGRTSEATENSGKRPRPEQMGGLRRVRSRRRVAGARAHRRGERHVRARRPMGASAAARRGDHAQRAGASVGGALQQRSARGGRLGYQRGPSRGFDVGQSSEVPRTDCRPARERRGGRTSVGATGSIDDTVSQRKTRPRPRADRRRPRAQAGCDEPRAPSDRERPGAEDAPRNPGVRRAARLSCVRCAREAGGLVVAHLMGGVRRWYKGTLCTASPPTSADQSVHRSSDRGCACSSPSCRTTP